MGRRETGEGEGTVKGKEGERWREGFGPPKIFLCGATYMYVQSAVLAMIDSVQLSV